MDRAKLLRFLGGVILLCALFCESASAQPILNFKRLINNWPTIELYFTVGCNGQPSYFTDKRYFKVYENGVEIGEFELWCPDPFARCAISVCLVFDVSGSMYGAGISGARDAGNAFVDEMDGVSDEAAIVIFNSMVTVLQGMTIYRDLLHNAINSLNAGGATAVWDGMYTGVQEVVNNGVNPCRAVICLTDGEDNSSSRTPADVIALANRNRIRVFTIGLGSSINSAQLEAIATLTGGRYYQTPSASQLAQIYREISTIIVQGFQECYITYTAKCMDGGLRTVDLSVINFCNGTDTKTKTYRAPKDTSTYIPLRIELGKASARGNSSRVRSVWILDEPFGDIDPITLREVSNAIKKINAKFGTTIILVSHHVDFVKEVSHRAILIENGAIIDDGDPSRVCNAFIDRCGAAYLRQPVERCPING